jgi:hypothetical protein
MIAIFSIISKNYIYTCRRQHGYMLKMAKIYVKSKSTMAAMAKGDRCYA